MAPRVPKKPAKPDQTTEQRILSSARGEFSRKGIAGARMQVIAQAAGVNKALLHYYFRSKEKLYEAVLSAMMSTVLSSFREAIDRTPQQADIRGLIHSIVSAYIHTLAGNRDFPPMMMREMIEGGKRIPAIIDAIISPSGDVPARILMNLQQGIRNGTIRPIEPIHVMMNIMTMVVGTFIFGPIASAIHRKILGTELLLDMEFFKRRIEAITDMACDGLFIEGKNS